MEVTVFELGLQGNSNLKMLPPIITADAKPINIQLQGVPLTCDENVVGN